MKKTSPLAMRYLIYTKKRDNKIMLKDFGYNKRLTTYEQYFTSQILG